MAIYRVDDAQVRDVNTEQLRRDLKGQPVQIVVRDTTTPAVILDAADGNPIPDSTLLVTEVFTVPRFWIDTATPDDLYLDWLDVGSGARGPVRFEAVLRDEARGARVAAEAAEASATSLSVGVVRSVNGQVPDSEGALTLAGGGGGSGVVVLDETSPVPSGTPSGVLVARAASAPPSATMTVVRDTATTFTSASGSTVDLALPSGTGDGDLLVAVVTSQNNSTTWTPPSADWVLLQQLDTSSSDFRTTNIYALNVSQFPPSGTQSFANNTSGRICGAMFRVTGADLTTPLLAGGQIGDRPADVYTVPELLGSAGGMALAVTIGQQGASDATPQPLVYSNGLVPFVSITTAPSGSGARTFLDIAAEPTDVDYPSFTVQVAATPNASFGAQALALRSDAA